MELPPIGRGKVFADAIDWLKSSDEYADSVGVLTENIRQLVNTAEGNGTGILDLANVFIQEKQTTGDDTDATTKLKLEKEEIFTKVLENGNGDVDKDLSVYFWQEQDDLEKLLQDRLVTDMKALTGKSADNEKELHDLWSEAIRMHRSVSRLFLLTEASSMAQCPSIHLCRVLLTDIGVEDFL